MDAQTEPILMTTGFRFVGTRGRIRRADLYSPQQSSDVPYMYHNHPELWGPVWSWTVETGNHALRIIFAGIFDRYPNAKLVWAYGETLPYQLWRFDSRWEISNRMDMTLERAPSEYLKRNFWCTTSGVCSDEPCAVPSMRLARIE